MQFQERVVQYPKKMKIVKVNECNEPIAGEAEILVNIVHDEGNIVSQGTPINAENLNKIDTAAQNAVATANAAKVTAYGASANAAQAVTDSSSAVTTANQANFAASNAATNAAAAVTTANSAKATAEAAMQKVTEGLSTKVSVGGVLQSSLAFTADPQVQLNEKAQKATNISGYGITDAYTKTEVDSKISSVYKYKGSVNNYSELPTGGRIIGEVWNVVNNQGKNYAWTGSNWDDIGGTVDLSDYYTKTQVDSLLNNKANKSSTLSGYGITDAYTKTFIDDNKANKGELAGSWRVVQNSNGDLEFSKV